MAALCAPTLPKRPTTRVAREVRGLVVRLRPGVGRANALPSPVLVGEGLLRRRVISRRHGGAVGLAIVSQLAGWQATHANA